MPLKAFREFFKLEAAGGIVLFGAALLAMVCQNTNLSSLYEQFLDIPVSLQIGPLGLSKNLLHMINDGLMAIFFLTVGLEIKKEILEGELNSTSKVILPGLAALGGMVFPAIIFSIINWNDSFAMQGWAIPTATDIAFSLGILSLLGKRVPVSLRIFLAALAIFDDLGAIIIIAIYYTAGLSWLALLVAFVCIVILVVLNRMHVGSLMPYFLVGFILWSFLLKSGIHATLAGVILAMAIPLRIPNAPNVMPMQKVQSVLHPWVAFGVLPLFAFVNAGVSFRDITLSELFSPIMFGISLGLLVGKTIGVFTTTFLAVKLGLARMPSGAGWLNILGIALVCGVGFTMSFFVGTLAYANGAYDSYDIWVRVGVIFGSLISGLLGYLVLKFSTKPAA